MGQLGKTGDRAPLRRIARERRREEAWRRKQERKQWGNSWENKKNARQKCSKNSILT